MNYLNGIINVIIGFPQSFGLISMDGAFVGENGMFEGKVFLVGMG
jgi:hypothetical protein